MVRARGWWDERSADPIDSPARPYRPLLTMHATRAQDQTRARRVAVPLFTHKTTYQNRPQISTPSLGVFPALTWLQFMCVYTHTHTHTTRRALWCELRGRDETLWGPENSDGLNLGTYVFAYVYKVYMCMYMLGDGMWSWTKVLFFFNIFFVPKKKRKRCENNTENSNPNEFELHRPSIKGTKLLFQGINAIIINTWNVQQKLSFFLFPYGKYMSQVLGSFYRDRSLSMIDWCCSSTVIGVQ